MNVVFLLLVDELLEASFTEARSKLPLSNVDTFLLVTIKPPSDDGKFEYGKWIRNIC